MIDMLGRLAPAPFRRAAMVRTALFVASIVGFPFLVAIVVVPFSGCRGIGGACGAMAAVTAMALKPLFFILFVASLIGISIRRSRDAGLPAWFGLFIPLMVSADSTFGIYAATPWGFPFSSGILHIDPPLYFAFAIACLIPLGLLPSRPDSMTTAARRKAPDMLLLAVGSAIALCAVVRLITTNAPTLLLGPYRLIDVPLTIMKMAPHLMVTFLALAAWIVFRERRWPSPPNGLRPTPTDESAPRRIPIAPAILAGSALAVAAILLGPPKLVAPSLLGFLASLSTVTLPTFALYIIPVGAIWYAIEKPTPAAVMLAVLSVTPFALWVDEKFGADAAQRNESAELAAIATSKLTHNPATLVIQHRGELQYAALMEASNATRIILKDRHGRSLQSYDGPRTPSGKWKFTEIAKLPDEYLLLRVGRDSVFAHRHNAHPTIGGPFELRSIGPGRDDVLAVWFKTRRTNPVFPPVLTKAGWATNQSATPLKQASVVDFMRRSLTEAQAPDERKASAER